MTKLRRLCGEVGARRTALRQRASEGSAEVVVAAVTRALARRRPAIRRPTQACVAVTGLVPPSAWAAAAGRTSGTRRYRAESGWSPGRTARCRAQPCGFQPVEAKVLRFPQGQFLCVARIRAPGLCPRALRGVGLRAVPLMRPSAEQQPREQCAEVRCLAAPARRFSRVDRRRCSGRPLGSHGNSLCYQFGGPRSHPDGRPGPRPNRPPQSPRRSSRLGEEGCRTRGEPPPPKSRCFFTSRPFALTPVLGSPLPTARVTVDCGHHSGHTPAATAGRGGGMSWGWGLLGDGHGNLFPVSLVTGLNSNADLLKM